MKRWRSKALVLAGVSLAAAIPAISQETPESLLPPGFSDPEALPSPVQAPPPPAPPAPATPAAPSEDVVVSDTAEADADADSESGPPPQPGSFDLPADARRDARVVGALGPSNWGLGADAFRNANGRFLTTLMRRMEAPLPSRWASILLRRALLTEAPAPGAVNPVDWAAERAWLLLRMGEADAARMLVQQVDVDRYTPKMVEVAAQTALATADPAALCPLVEPGRKLSDERIWPLADAMCAALAGNASRASTLIDQARRRGGNDIDLMLAEKVVGAGSDTRRAVNLDWQGVDRLNAWRFGMASAVGTEIPAALMEGARLHIWAWQARAPMVPLEQRLAASNVAASLGVFSSSALVELYSLVGDRTDPSEMQGSVAQRLGQAYAGDTDARIAALRNLWGDGRSGAERHARLVLTAGAAARIAPSVDREEIADELIAAMLTAGMDRRAARWIPAVAEMDGADGSRAWALLAVAAPNMNVDSGRIGDVLDADTSTGQIRSRLLVAALAGLGRIDADTAQRLGSDLGIDFDRRNVWVEALERAASRGQRGAVAILAGTGMQTGRWQGVPPEHLYRTMRALRSVGLEYEARMIAAEALYRA